MQLQMAQFGHVEGQRKKSKTEEDGSYQTAQIGLGERGRKKSKNGLDLIWIEIGFFLNSRNQPAHPVMGTIFLVGQAKQAPHCGCSIEISCDICVGRYVCPVQNA